MNDITTKLTTDEQRQIIERMIDGSTVMELLETIAGIAYEKAEHIRSNWQDEKTAKAWDHDARIIEKAAERIMC